MNLHGMVRAAINTVNPDIVGTWLESAAPTTATDGKRTPTFVTHVNVGMQVQALTGRDLQHEVFQNAQGVKRSVYLFGNVQGVARPNAKGGDLLLFPETRGGVPRTWLVVAVLETWTPDVTGWCKVGVVLQEGTP